MRIRALVSLIGLASSLAIAETSDVPLTNWTVPPYHARSGGITTMTDATPPRAFIGIQPCRVADTRGNGAPIQGGIFTNGQVRTWDLTGICGIPAGAEAISANFTVTGSPSAPPGAFLLAWPTGGPVPPVSILNFQAGQTLANAAIVPLGAGEQINVNVSHSTHVILDVNGYFSDTLQNPANSFRLTSAEAGATMLVENTSTASEASAIQGVITTTTPGPTGVAAIKGFNQGTNNTGIGVWGKHNGGGWGVLGESQSGYGVYGTTTSGFGVVASTASGSAAVWAGNASSANDSSGVFGWASATSGVTYGGNFRTESTSLSGPAGVLGVAVIRPAFPNASSLNFRVGVRGEGTYGVTGIGVYKGVGGGVVQNGSVLAAGSLGYQDGGSNNYGVFSEGNYGGFGAKYFVEPHPHDASKVIRYVSLEGNESGTYFRGRGKFQNGIAQIEVPEDFRLVTESEGLSVVATPIGPMATVSVASVSLERIVLRGSRNVEFFYIVNGVRKTHRHLTPIGPGREFMPDSPDAKMPLYLTDGQKEMLISNGTYKPDGTVNIETARRLGWDKEWENRERPEPQPVSD